MSPEDVLDNGNAHIPKVNNGSVLPPSAITENKMTSLYNNNNQLTNGWKSKNPLDINGGVPNGNRDLINNNNNNNNNVNKNNFNGWSSPVRENSTKSQTTPQYPVLNENGNGRALDGDIDHRQDEHDADDLQANNVEEEEKLIGGNRSRNGNANGTIVATNGKANSPEINGNKTGNVVSEKENEEMDPLTGKKSLKVRHGGTADSEPDDGEDDELDDTEIQDNEITCGMGSCQPKWARKLATTHVFMIVFLLAWVFQGMFFTYIVSVITTIEKLFQIQSKVTGMLMSATEVGQISTALFLTYFAGRGHRPRWIACGMVVFAISSFGCTLPHFIFGDQLLHANNVFHGGNKNAITSAHHSKVELSLSSNHFLPMDNSTSPISDQNFNLCLANGFNNSNFNRSDKDCQENVLEEQATHNQITNIVLVIFVVSLLGVGVGQTAVSTLGIPYIDDNVASRESPIYIAITIGVRILGPAFGFILGSVCTRMYVDVYTDPGMSPSDPRWVGAWWLGLLIVSGSMMMTSLAMFLFPKHLRGDRIPPPAKMREIEEKKKLEKKQQDEENKRPQLKDFPKTIKRQLSNDILMCRTASSVLHLLPVAGLYTFLPKYMETQFRLTAHDANLISGIGGILVMGVGIVISGVVILKFNPTARSVAAWIAFTALVYSCGMAILMFIGCPMDDLVGLNLGRENAETNNLTPLYSSNPYIDSVCNLTCNCDFDKFSPICGSDGLTYFSSCHAGCNASYSENGVMKFSNCECIPPVVLPDSLGSPGKSFQDAVSGFCEGSCKKFLPFILLFSFFVFMHSTGEVGSMLLIMRCTDPKDKAMAMGIIQFAIGLFGNVPCPIIYGAVVDSACLVWEKICDKQGACSLYNVDLFRHFFLGTTAGIMGLAFIMDVVVWRKAHRIDIDPSSNSETESEKPAVPESTV